MTTHDNELPVMAGCAIIGLDMVAEFAPTCSRWLAPSLRSRIRS